jgi:hypothetical protein
MVQGWYVRTALTNRHHWQISFVGWFVLPWSAHICRENGIPVAAEAKYEWLETTTMCSKCAYSSACAISTGPDRVCGLMHVCCVDSGGCTFGKTMTWVLQNSIGYTLLYHTRRLIALGYSSTAFVCLEYQKNILGTLSRFCVLILPRLPICVKRNTHDQVLQIAATMGLGLNGILYASLTRNVPFHRLRLISLNPRHW